MKKISTIVSIFAFVAAAIGLIVAAVYFLDRKFGFFGCCDEEVEDVDFVGEEYYAEDLAEEEPAVVVETAVEVNAVEETAAEEASAEEQA